MIHGRLPDWQVLGVHGVELGGVHELDGEDAEPDGGHPHLGCRPQPSTQTNQRAEIIQGLGSAAAR